MYGLPEVNKTGCSLRPRERLIHPGKQWLLFTLSDFAVNGNPTPKSSHRRQQKLYQTYSGPSKETQFGIKDSKDLVGISYLIVLSDELLMAHHAFLQFTNVDINMILDITQTKPQDNQTQMKHRRPSANDIVIHQATITCTQFHVFPIHGKDIQAKV